MSGSGSGRVGAAGAVVGVSGRLWMSEGARPNDRLGQCVEQAECDGKLVALGPAESMRTNSCRCPRVALACARCGPLDGRADRSLASVVKVLHRHPAMSVKLSCAQVRVFAAHDQPHPGRPPPELIADAQACLGRARIAACTPGVSVNPAETPGQSSLALSAQVRQLGAGRARAVLGDQDRTLNR